MRQRRDLRIRLRLAVVVAWRLDAVVVDQLLEDADLLGVSAGVQRVGGLAGNRHSFPGDQGLQWRAVHQHLDPVPGQLLEGEERRDLHLVAEHAERLVGCREGPL